MALTYLGKKKNTVDEHCYSQITELLSNSLSKHL